jgi:arylsulfatase A-like enzyme
VLFENAATPVPITLPAHASLLTGLGPSGHGIRDNGLYRLPDDLPTLAEAFAEAGYATAGVVAAAVLDRQYGLDRGFARYDDRVSGGGLTIAERNATEVTDAALSAVREMGSPFFLFVHYFDPHAEYRPPPPLDASFRDRPYDGEIAYMDRELGRLRAGLEAMGRFEGAVVAITADHGESLGEHGEPTHGVFLYESTIRIPMILLAPGRLPAGTRVETFAHLTDVFPTLLDLVGVPSPAEVHGRSLLPFIDASDGARADGRWLSLESEFGYNAYGWAPLEGLTDGRLKWIGAPSPELYDLSADPGETRNLEESRPDDADRLRRLRTASAQPDRRADPPGGASPSAEAERLDRLSGLGYVAATARPPADDRPLPDPKRVIGTLDLINHAREALAAGRYDEAVRVLQSVRDQSPDSLSALVLQGSALLQSARPGEALAPLRRAAELSPANADVRYNLGLALLGSGDDAGAEAAWRATIALAPRYHDAVANLVDLLQSSGRSSEGERALREGRRRGLESPVLDFLEGRLAWERGDAATARTALTRALAGPLPPALARDARQLLAALPG